VTRAATALLLLLTLGLTACGASEPAEPAAVAPTSTAAVAPTTTVEIRHPVRDARQAKANLRNAIPAIEAYYVDNQTYVGVTLAGIQASYDAGIENITFGTLIATSYCVQSIVGTATVSKSGPSADIIEAPCA
jgi:ABC-type glycerol-3-phosphate transport system substrate-binding protein